MKIKVTSNRDADEAWREILDTRQGVTRNVPEVRLSVQSAAVPEAVSYARAIKRGLYGTPGFSARRFQQYVVARDKRRGMHGKIPFGRQSGVGFGHAAVRIALVIPPVELRQANGGMILTHFAIKPGARA